MADRVGVISKGRILLVDDKDAMMRRLGTTEARFILARPMTEVPASLAHYPVTLEEAGGVLAYRGGDGAGAGKREIAELAQDLTRAASAIPGSTPRKLARGDLREAGRRPIHRRGARRQRPERVGGMNLRGALAIFKHELLRAFPHLLWLHPLAGDHHLALFHRLWRGHRRTDRGDRRRLLRGLHRPGPADAHIAVREHHQCQLRRLHAALYRGDLRAALGARGRGRDADRLRRARRRSSRSSWQR